MFNMWSRRRHSGRLVFRLPFPSPRREVRDDDRNCSGINQGEGMTWSRYIIAGMLLLVGCGERENHDPREWRTTTIQSIDTVDAERWGSDTTFLITTTSRTIVMVNFTRTQADIFWLKQRVTDLEMGRVRPETRRALLRDSLYGTPRRKQR